MSHRSLGLQNDFLYLVNITFLQLIAIFLKIILVYLILQIYPYLYINIKMNQTYININLQNFFVLEYIALSATKAHYSAIVKSVNMSSFLPYVL